MRIKKKKNSVRIAKEASTRGRATAGAGMGAPPRQLAWYDVAWQRVSHDVFQSESRRACSGSAAGNIRPAGRRALTCCPLEACSLSENLQGRFHRHSTQCGGFFLLQAQTSGRLVSWWSSPPLASGP